MITLRQAAITDSNALVDLSKQLGYETDEASLIKRFLMLEEKDQKVIVAEKNKKIVGYISYEKYFTLYMDPGLNITGLVVDKMHHRLGIGKKLIDNAEDYAVNNKLSFLRANSGFSRNEAHEFYRRIGFVNEKDQKRFIREIAKK